MRGCLCPTLSKVKNKIAMETQQFAKLFLTHRHWSISKCFTLYCTSRSSFLPSIPTPHPFHKEGQSALNWNVMYTPLAPFSISCTHRSTNTPNFSFAHWAIFVFYFRTKMAPGWGGLGVGRWGQCERGYLKQRKSPCTLEHTHKSEDRERGKVWVIYSWGNLMETVYC